MHPFTQIVPKELLPLSPRPAIGYIADELVASGIERIIVITAPGKESVMGYLRWWKEHEKSSDRPIEILSVIQKEPLGLGDAILMAQGLVDESYFGVVLPDDLIVHTVPALQQLHDIAQSYSSPVIALQEVVLSDTHRYGIISSTWSEDSDHALHEVSHIVEKPLNNPPSCYAVVGRYILPTVIFEHLRELKKYHSGMVPGISIAGELQLTSALNLLCAQTTVYGYVCAGTRYDIGTPPGWAAAVAQYSQEHVSFR